MSHHRGRLGKKKDGVYRTDSDLGRVGITPHPSRLCTEVAKRPETIRWADERASRGAIPELVEKEWRIDLAGFR
jgi:uncharacterized protein